MRRSQRLKILENIRYDISRMSTLVMQQLDDAVTAFDSGDLALASGAIEKDDLVDNLNLRVENAAIELISGSEASDSESLAARTALKVAINLERVGDAATHIAKRLHLVVAEEVERRYYDLGPVHRIALQSVEDSVQAFLQEDLDLAKRACELEPELDKAYVDCIMFVRASVHDDPYSIDYLLHLLSVLKYLEKIGDYVLNIGEQAIYAITGKHLKFAQFQQLDSLLGSGGSGSGSDQQFSMYRDGISGAVVARLGGTAPLVFKEGAQRKIEEEVEQSRAWHHIDEMLTPRVLSTVSFEDRQAFLREYVDGDLLSHIYFVEGDPHQQLRATERLCETLLRVWNMTFTLQQPKIDYVEQIEKRLDEVYLFHPNLRHTASGEFRYRNRLIASLDEQLALVKQMEPLLAPPFSIWLHGDFNANNVVYNRGDNSIKFIDIHRSRLGDYLQDITVFLVGLHRDPDLSASTREQLKQVESKIMSFVDGFASQFGDEKWNTRLQLGLARSYLTSARIILQPTHAEWLFRQGRLALHRVVQNA